MTGQVHVSIEVPVFKGCFLKQCIDSVFAQTSNAWTLSLLWDGGDRESWEILQQLARKEDSRIRVRFAQNQGIAATRKYLSDHSEGDYILPLDDDDTLPPTAVERFLDVAKKYPWASLIRGRRSFIDTTGAIVVQEPWFPFERRHYDRGMVTDLSNQAQPYLIRRSAYLKTQGWRGFSELMGAGEDCDMFLQLEEVAHFELIDEDLYHYRLHDHRASHLLTPAGAFEMWRRLADATVTRLGLPLRRVNDAPPFVFEGVSRPAATLEDVDFVVEGPDGSSVESLRHCGVAENAIHYPATASTPGTWKMAGFRTTQRRLICFLDKHLEFNSKPALEAFVSALDRHGGDLLAPRLHGESGARLMPPTAEGLDGAEDLPIGPEENARQKVRFPFWLAGECLLVRREVVTATGGFDDCHVPVSLQTVDFCIQARRRGFRCVEIPPEGVVYHGPLDPTWTDHEVSALRLKWHSHADLLQS